jgi:hypothetical protein
LGSSAFGFGGCDRRFVEVHHAAAQDRTPARQAGRTAGPQAPDFQVIFGSSITSTVIVVFVLNLVFNHWSWRQPKADDAIDEALSYGAVAVDVPDGGVNPHGGDVNPHGGGQPAG